MERESTKAARCSQKEPCERSQPIQESGCVASPDFAGFVPIAQAINPQVCQLLFCNLFLFDKETSYRNPSFIFLGKIFSQKNKNHRKYN